MKAADVDQDQEKERDLEQVARKLGKITHFSRTRAAAGIQGATHRDHVGGFPCSVVRRCRPARQVQVTLAVAGPSRIGSHFERGKEVQYDVACFDVYLVY